MSYLIKMPQMGLEMEEGEVVTWEVAEGESVETGDVIAVVESEKAANDVEAREDGVVRDIVVPEGGVAEPGEPIGIFGGPDEDISDHRSEIEAQSSGQPDAEPAEATGDASSAQTTAGTSASAGGSRQEAQTIRATPGAKDLASDADLDLADVDGTGPQGTITEADIEQRVNATPSTEEPESGTAEEVRATPGAKRLAGERDVELQEVDGTGPQGVITEDDVEQYEPTDVGGTDSSGTAVRATPGAKQLASNQGVDLSAVEGTGPQGVITEDDVAEHEVAGAVDTGQRVRTVAETRSLSGMQQTVGDRMSQSYQTAPHVTLNRSFDVSAMQNVLTAADRVDADASLSDLLLAGFGAQLAETPAMNALYEDEEHKFIEEVNIGVAVDVEDGLVTPVVPLDILSE